MVSKKSMFLIVFYTTYVFAMMDPMTDEEVKQALKEQDQIRVAMQEVKSEQLPKTEIQQCEMQQKIEPVKKERISESIESTLKHYLGFSK